uniref:Fibronectin type-III domain-containing protein n=1 Tax=Periophthalmus magnuspinnatus TaxID=409849 RepID=A0A3B4ATL7_9GOBI
SGLAVTSSSTRSLGLSWQAGPGRTQRYRLLLWQHPYSTHLSGNTAIQYTLKNLMPGRKYNITMVTESGGLQNSTSIEAQTVPAAVSNITLDDRNSTSLLLSWQQPEGDLDTLIITVFTSDTRVWETHLLPNATQVNINNLTPGTSYKITMMSSIQGLSNQSEITLTMVPEAVSELALSPSSDGGLLLSWSAPHGFWDGYRFFLFDGTQQLVNTTVNREAVNFTIPGTSVTPGRLYKGLLRVERGELYAEQACEGSSAPAPVLDLHIRHADETSLSAMWSHPSGSRDSYFLIIRHGNMSMDTREVQANMRECTFNVLTPGRHYTITVVSRSRMQNSSASVEGQTGVYLSKQIYTYLSTAGVDSLQVLWEKPPGDVESYMITLLQNRSVSKFLINIFVPASVTEITTSNGGRSDALQVSWRPAAGAVDSYMVRLQDGSRTVHTLAVSHSSTPECSFSSLVAGRLYSVVIVTRSGSLENSTTLQARTRKSLHCALGVFVCNISKKTCGYLKKNCFKSITFQKSIVVHNECVFTSLKPGRLYTVIVETWSGDYVSTVSTDGRTFPAAVGNLSVVNAGMDDLTVTWSPAPGDVDHYEVLHCSLTTLKFFLRSHLAVRCAVTSLSLTSVPSAVRKLQLIPAFTETLGGLIASWAPAPGDIDMYIVSLYTETDLIDSRSVQKHVSSREFVDLTPGQLYIVTVRSESGKLTNNSTARSPARVTALQADNGHTTHSLTVSWERPVGVFDSYRLQLLDQDSSVLINRTVAMESRSEQLENLTSGKWYKVRVVTLSGGVPSLEATAEGQTRPAAVSNLTVVSANMSSLSFSWRPSDGHVDMYDLSLYRVLENNRQEAAEDRPEVGVVCFKILPPRRGLIITHYILCRTQMMPAPVSFLEVQSSGHTDRLTVSWHHGEGGRSSYQVFFYDSNEASLSDQTMAADRNSHTFSGLVPGRLYRAKVITHSGELINSAVALGRTSPDPPSYLSVKQGPTNDTILLSWAGPAHGDYSNFSLQWAPPDQLTVTPVHMTEAIVNGMFPGRLYNFSLVTVSGGTDGSMAWSQPIQHSVRTSRCFGVFIALH